MKKSLIAIAAVALISLSSPSFAVDDATLNKVGKKIYDRAFGRGCGACHDIDSNPQLASLIKAGKLDEEKFASVIKEGKNGMPKAIKAIMDIKPVKKAGLTEDEAIKAVYQYLSK